MRDSNKLKYDITTLNYINRRKLGCCEHLSETNERIDNLENRIRELEKKIMNYDKEKL